MTELILVLINKSIITADATLIMNRALYKNCNVVYFHWVQLKLLTQQTCYPVLVFKNMLNDIPAKLIYRLFLTRSLSRPYIHLECFMSSILSRQLL